MKIFVTLGTTPFSFERLVKELDLLLAEKKVKAEVFAQIGGTAKTYQPQNMEWRETLSPAEFESKIKNADLIIAHAGAGAIMTPLQLGKPVIAVPRRQKFKEHSNDHQLELARAISASGRALAVFEMQDLEKAVKKAKTLKTVKTRKKNRIGEIIEQALWEWKLVE